MQELIQSETRSSGLPSWLPWPVGAGATRYDIVDDTLEEYYLIEGEVFRAYDSDGLFLEARKKASEGSAPPQ